MAGARFQSLDKLRAQMCTADCGNPWRLDRGLLPSAAFRPRIAMNRIITALRIATDRCINLRADCHRPDLTACRYSWQPEHGAWQSAVHLRAVCWGVILLWQSAAFDCGAKKNERIPVPAILHRHFWRTTFEMEYSYTADFLGLNYTQMVSVDRPSRRTIPFSHHWVIF
jgi:hypothetical protein